MRKLTIALPLLAVTAALAACGEKQEPATTAPVTTQSTTSGGGGGGGQGGGQGPSPREQVTRAVEDVIGSGDVGAACVELVTAKYVKAAYGDEQGCKAAVSKQGSFDVAVSKVEIQGDAATAKAKPARGPNKGETITAKLVLQGDTWRVDSLRSNAPAGP
ncbi:MAG: hypothetical protein ABI726_11215 [bacterium]